jgi:hypothetical protein
VPSEAVLLRAHTELEEQLLAAAASRGWPHDCRKLLEKIQGLHRELRFEISMIGYRIHKHDKSARISASRAKARAARAAMVGR